MHKDAIRALLPALNSKVTGSRAGWVFGHCPYVWKHGGIDNNPSFAISDKPKKRSIFKCLSCGSGGDLDKLLWDIREYLHSNKDARYNLPAAAKIINNELLELDVDPSALPDYEEAAILVNNPFPEEWLNTFKPVHLFPEAMEYCADRGVDFPHLKELDLRFDSIQRRVCFPFRNFKGQLMGMQGRDIDENDPKKLRYNQYGFKGLRNMHVWMGEHTIDFDKPVIALEGPFDFTSVYRVYKNILASFTTGLSLSKIKRISDATEIITLYDYGKGGDAARGLLDKHLKNTPITHLIPTQHQGDPGKMSLQEVATLLQPYLKLHKK